MESYYPPIPGAAIAGLAVSVIICFALPIGGLIYCRRKYGKVWKPYLIGMAAFVVSQMLIRIPLVTSVLPQQRWFAELPYNNYFLYGLFMAFTAGLFEEAARFICVRFFLKKQRRWGDALAFGFGHGGVEAILITGLSLISYLAMCLAVNSGTFGTMAAAMTGEQLEAITVGLYSLTFTTSLVGGVERIIAVALHIGMTVIVFRGFVIGKRWLYLVYAIAVHTAVDLMAVLLPSWGVTGWWMELCFAVMTAAVVAWALWMKRNTNWNSKEEIQNEEISRDNSAAPVSDTADGLRDE